MFVCFIASGSDYLSSLIRWGRMKAGSCVKKAKNGPVLHIMMSFDMAPGRRHTLAEKAKYPPYKPEQLKHPAMDGTMMRSKSEVIIANMLIQAGIPFVYEAPLFINGKNVLPDFTILSLIDLKTVIIIEHQGMVFVDEYANKFIRSLRLYLQTDWIPNKSLFF